MKRDQLQALRAESIESLNAKITDSRDQIFKGRLAGAVQGQGIGMKARSLRRLIARCQTIINEKKAAAAGKVV